MKKKTSKINIIINPPRLAQALLSRLGSYIVKYSYRLGLKSAPMPKGIVFVINENCNARCKMCDVGTKTISHINKAAAKPGESFLPIGAFKKVIDSVRSAKPEIWLMATEPLLYPYFIEAAEYTVKNGLRFQFTTNGILLPRYAEDIVRAGVGRVILSFMGGNSQTHDKVIGIDGAFDNMIKGIELISRLKKQLKQNKPGISINFVITGDNYKQLCEHIEVLSGLDVDKITISNTQFVTKDMVSLHKAISASDNVTESSVVNFDPAGIDTRLLEKQLRLVFAKLSGLNIAVVPNIKNFDQLDQYYKSPVQFLKGYDICYYPWRFAHILPNGDVAVSWRCFGKALGNINDKTYAKIWNDLPIKEFRSRIIAHKGHYPTCARCGFLWCSYNM